MTGRQGSDCVLPVRGEHRSGPLVAVCSLVGGAGASTLALAVAYAAARASHAPVLLAELLSDRAALGGMTGHRSDCSLTELAAGRRPGRPYVQLPDGPRLLAAEPRRPGNVSSAQVEQTLRGARSAHALVVLDCGPLSATCAPALGSASHIVWVVRAEAAAADRAEALLRSRCAPAAGRVLEMLVAVAPPTFPCSVRRVRQVAGDRCRAVTLVAHEPRLPGSGLADAITAYSDAADEVIRLVR